MMTKENISLFCDPEIKLQSRVAAIHDVSVVFEEILDQFIRVANPKWYAVSFYVIVRNLFYMIPKF